MIYLDTSLLVALLCREPRSQDLLVWLAGNPDQEFAISHWTQVEFASALSVKLRTAQISEAEANAAGTQFGELVDGSVVILALNDQDYARASDYCEAWRVGLRAPDALHLAIAQRTGCPLATLDNGLYRAARHFGIAALIP